MTVDFLKVVVISTYTRSGSIEVENILNAQVIGTNLNQAVTPDNIYHGAIMAFGKVYEFIAENGIVISDMADYIRDNDPMWRDSEFLTGRTELEFTVWLNEQSLTNYTSDSYKLADNNCLTFVAQACEFLGGMEPTKLANQRQFALNNSESALRLTALKNLEST